MVGLAHIALDVHLEIDYEFCLALKNNIPFIFDMLISGISLHVSGLEGFLDNLMFAEVIYWTTR